MRTIKWTEQAIINELKNMAQTDKDGVAYSGKAKAGLRVAVYRVYSNWQNACKIAGVKNAFTSEDENETSERSNMIKIDLSQGIKVKYNDSSVCFNCKWATGKGDCSWVKSFTMPKNAIYYEKKIKTNTDETALTPIIIYCPDFIKG